MSKEQHHTKEKKKPKLKPKSYKNRQIQTDQDANTVASALGDGSKQDSRSMKRR